MHSTARIFARTMMVMVTLLTLLHRIKAQPLANLNDAMLLEESPEEHALRVRNVESCNLDHIYNLIKEACTSYQPMRRRRDTQNSFTQFVADVMREDDSEDNEGAAAHRRQKRKALEQHLMDKCCSRSCTAHNFVRWCP